jgi:hypothetical protein
MRSDTRDVCGQERKNTKDGEHVKTKDGSKNAKTGTPESADQRRERDNGEKDCQRIADNVD